MFNKSVETVATVQADAAPPELVPLSPFEFGSAAAA